MSGTPPATRQSAHHPPAFHSTASKEGGSTQVLISCPDSGELVPTGVYALTVEDLVPSPYVLSWCPGCDGTHESTREDAITSLH